MQLVRLANEKEGGGKITWNLSHCFVIHRAVAQLFSNYLFQPRSSSSCLLPLLPVQSYFCPVALLFAPPVFFFFFSSSLFFFVVLQFARVAMSGVEDGSKMANNQTNTQDQEEKKPLDGAGQHINLKVKGQVGFGW